ncbi:MAG: 30S ribosomal protein S30 [Candidatus Korarchaeota archaeon]|nr:30S ribosomal protein S30 [Candidatus Korarchaeota archaeon]NIU84671.1 30S ribosomal protein S30 [Candidatus Thorarchaeota archaeon]NIW14692.1 30S ribosomal protein S30 [Candidatus Thorarchaeota archaeon]NIW52763.1 30S ribosomal protein S30 [Candidatus Korarchaeota archaeon]
MTHGSLDKAGKVRRRTEEQKRRLGIEKKERTSPTPRINNRIKFRKRVKQGQKKGQSRQW